MVKSKNYRRSTFLIILLGTYILFHDFFESIISETIVTYFLSYCESTIVNDFILFSTLVCILFLMFKNIKRIASLETRLASIAFFAMYLFYRLNSDIWIFTKFRTFEFFAYTDIFAIITCVYFVISSLPIFLKSNKALKSEFSFFDDEPVYQNKQDELGYEEYAVELTKRIENTEIQKSFAIGINGQWGFGKTSFINLIKKNLNSEENIIVDFNPWSSQNSEVIINDFFETLQKEIRPYYSSLADELIRYSDKLSIATNNYFSNILQVVKISNSLGRTGSLDLYTEINSKIEQLNKKVIVFIDDLDRLNKAELLSVIRLIRNTADFHQTFFIVAYDRNYILEGIKEHNPLNYHLFLEKIFQIEINLPSFNKKILREKLTEKLKTIITEGYHKEISEEILGNGFSQPAYL